jgi:hypothetical protein
MPTPTGGAFFLFAWGLGAYYISRGHVEHASAPLRSRTHTTHCWQPPAVVPPQEDQEGDQETPDNTERLPPPVAQYLPLRRAMTNNVRIR